MSSIPLPALDVKQPESPLDVYGKIQGIKSMLQQQQTQQQLAPLQVQEAQNTVQSGQQQQQLNAIKLQDAQAGMQAMKQWDGKNIDVLPELIRKNGGSLDAVTAAQTGILKQKTDLQNYNKAQLDQNATKNDYLLGKLQTVTDGPSLLKAAQEAVTDGYLDPQHAQQLQQLAQSDPATLKDQLGVFEKGLMGQKEQFSQEKQLRDQKLAEQKEAFNEAGGQDPAKREMNDWLAKNPDKGPSDFAVWKAKQAPLATFNVNNQAGGGLNDAALDQAAERYAQTGVLPAMGMGAAGAAARKAIMNRAGELHPDGSIAANSGAYNANVTSLKSLQKNFDQVNAFENTAGKNLDLFLSTAKKVVDSGSPILNTPVRLVSDKLAGSENMAAFNAARTTVLTEIAKVLNSSNASGVLSDSARGEVSKLIGPDATLKQIYSAANILKTDMGNRHDAYQDQIADIQKRIGGQPQKSDEPPKQNVIYARDPQGKLHTAPAGTALPSGWKQEQASQ